MQFSLTSLGITKDDEVITVANTYVATLLAVSAVGAKPVLVDAEKMTMLMDTANIESRITAKTKAIMPVHLYGQMANMREIHKKAKEHGLFIVEDSCQAHLARYDGKLAGSLSELACYSFFPSKNLGGIGNGGMVVTNSRKLAKKVKILRDPTSDNPLLLKSYRTPSYLDWIQMAFIKCKLKYLQEWIDKRREIARIYQDELANLSITLPFADKRAYHTYRDFVIRAEKRDKIRKYLRRKGVETVVHYPEPVHLLKIYRHLNYKKGDFPVAERLCSTVLSLPINPFLSEEEVHYTIKALKAFFN
jgi:dTDP-4-amino-4,6-dideoxygalactose transaminase